MNFPYWPDITRPGVPLSPQRSGWHLLRCLVFYDGKKLPMGEPVLHWWDSKEWKWFYKPKDGTGRPPEDFISMHIEYYMAAFSPVDMQNLQDEVRRECADLCDKIYKDSGEDMEYGGVLSVAEELRAISNSGPEEKYYIVDMRENWKNDRYLSFWRPDNRGYAYPLAWAGQFTASQIRAQYEYYNQRKGTAGPWMRFPIACATVEAGAIMPMRGQIDGNVGPVVPNTPAMRAALRAARAELGGE